MPVLLVLFTALHLSRRAKPALMAAAIVAAGLVWMTSPYLRQRIADVGPPNIRGMKATRRYRRPSEYSTGASRSASLPRLPCFRPRHRFDPAAVRPGSRRTDRAGRRGRQQSAQSDPQRCRAMGTARRHLVLYGMWLSHSCRFAAKAWRPGSDLSPWCRISSAHCLNSHLFDFHEGWMYVLGVGVAGGMSLRATIRRPRSLGTPASRSAA